MNKCGLVALAAIVWTALSAMAQDTNYLKTQIGQFENRTGSVIIKAFGLTGSVMAEGAEISVRCKETTDVSIGRKMYGLAVQIEGSAVGYDRIYIDDNEIDPLLSGLNYLIKITYEVTALPGFEASYATRGGLQIVANSIRREGGIRFSLQGNDTRPVSLTSVQISQLYTLIGQARKNLDAIKAEK